MSIQVVFETAFFWRCPECEGSNFVKGAPAELTPDESSEWSIRLGCDATEMVTVPTEVDCGHCLKKFDVAPEP